MLRWWSKILFSLYYSVSSVLSVVNLRDKLAAVSDVLEQPHHVRNRPLFAWAVATTVAMFPLIWMGGLVTSKGAGMSVPDWPNTFGYNMWAVPWGHWLGDSAGGVFYEHFHRLLGTLVGFFATATVFSAFGVARCNRVRKTLGWATVGLLGIAAITYMAAAVVTMTPAGAKQGSHVMSLAGAFGATTAVAWTCRSREPRRWLRWLAITLLLAVILQGLLGGLRVRYVSLDLAIIHGIFGQLTLCLGGVLCLAASGWWARAPHERRAGLVLPAVVLVGVCVAQLAVAAVMRHYEAGLAVPDFPLHYGQILPPMDQASLEAANAIRAWDYRPPLKPVSLGQIWLHVAHRLGAVLVTLAALWTAWRLWRVARGHVLTILGLVAVQITLGIYTVWWGKPADLATLHVATGAALLLATALLAARMVRRYGWRPAPAMVGVADGRTRATNPPAAAVVAP